MMKFKRKLKDNQSNDQSGDDTNANLVPGKENHINEEEKPIFVPKRFNLRKNQEKKE